MSALAHLLVLAVLFTALRGRLPWTRVGGSMLATAGLAGLAVSWSSPDVRSRLRDPDLWPALAFVVLAAVLAWWTMRSEQRRTTPIHEAAGPESLARFVPGSLPVLGVAAVLLSSALVSSPLGLAPDSAASPVTSSAISTAALSSSPAVPWFLLGLAELSRHLGPLVAWLLVPLATVGALVATPFLDTSRPETEGPFRGRRDEAPFFLWAWLGLGLSPLVAALFGRAMPPTPTIPTSTGDVALAEWFWLDLLGRPEPSLWVLRELPGLALLALIAVMLPARLPRWRATRGVFGRHLRRLGRRRYFLLCGLLLLFMLVPVGLLMRSCGFGPWLRLGTAGRWWL